MRDDDEVVVFWRQHVEAWKKSDLTQRDYCAAHGLARRTFCKYRMRFKADDAAAERVLSRRRRRKVRPSDGPSANHSAMAPKAPPFGVPRPNRRRHFPDELKRQIVMETFAPDATVSSVARAYGVTPPCVFRWRKLMGLGVSDVETTFATVRVSDENSTTEEASNSLPPLVMPPLPTTEPKLDDVEIELSGGKRLRFARDVDAETVRRIIEIVEGAVS